VWLTERGGRISLRQIDDRFAQFRRLAELPDDLSVHSLRHSCHALDRGPGSRARRRKTIGFDV
jgi:site-specific recombinase XerC